jgi:hypothetical protein
LNGPVRDRLAKDYDVAPRTISGDSRFAQAVDVLRENVGADRDHMKDQLGEAGLALYDQLQLDQEKAFLGIGGEVNIGTGHRPVAVIGWSGDATRKLKDANPHIWNSGGYA